MIAGSPSISWTDVAGGVLPGSGNLSVDPQVDATGRLTATSPVIDAGSTALVDPTSPTDVDGDPRRVDDPAVSDTGSGAPPAVDLGADERVPPDADGDGWGDGADCAPADPALWSLPGEATGLTLLKSGGSVSLTWNAPPQWGGTSAPTFDLLRADSPSGFGSPSATCVLTGTAGTSGGDPAPGTAYYLVRTVNGCGGNAGTASNGAPIPARACP